MSLIRGLWCAVPVDADASPELARLRGEVGATGDVYFFRLLLWAMRFRQSGRIQGDDWIAVAEQLRWPEGAAELRGVMERSGVVEPTGDIFGWRQYNGWILRKYAADRDRHRKKVKAGKASGKKRRLSARGKVVG